MSKFTSSPLWRGLTGILIGSLLSYIGIALLSASKRGESSPFALIGGVLFYPPYGFLLLLEYILPDVILGTIAPYASVAFWPIVCGFFFTALGQQQSRLRICIECAVLLFVVGCRIFGVVMVS